MNYKIIGDKIAFHPGYYLEEYLGYEHLDYMSASDRLGISLVDICNFLNGLTDVYDELATKLAELTNTSKEFWLNLQSKFDGCIYDEDVSHPIYPYCLDILDLEGRSFFVARSKVLKQCIGEGRTEAEAIKELAENERVWIEFTKEEDKD